MPHRAKAASRETIDLLLASVSRETINRLELFVALLLRWNHAVNLISRRDEGAVWHRHILDSLQLIPLIRPGHRRAIDIGSGAGFPGLVLALTTGIVFDLVEADQRKAAFLREAVRATGAPAAIHEVRAEAANLAPASLVTARALAPLPVLLPVAARLLAPSGECLFPKGANADAELTAASCSWHMLVERFPSRTSRSALILRISEIRRAGLPD